MIDRGLGFRVSILASLLLLPIAHSIRYAMADLSGGYWLDARRNLRPVFCGGF